MDCGSGSAAAATPHQLLERRVLMGLRFQCGTFDLLQQDVETGLQVEVGLQHLGVDEEADQALGLYRVRLAIGTPTRISGCPL